MAANAPTRGHPPSEWDLGKLRFNDKKPSKISAIAVDRFRQRYGWGRALSTLRRCQGIHHFDRLFALPRSHDWASVPPPHTYPSLRQGFCMTTSFPETKAGLRFGLASLKVSLAVTGCLAAVLATGLPVRAQDNPVLAKVNGVEIRQSDVALA